MAEAAQKKKTPAARGAAVAATGKPTRGKGEGAVFQRENGLWVARIELTPKNGVRRRREVTAKSKQKLLAKLDDERQAFRNNDDLPSATQTLESFLTYWFENVAVRKLRPRTAAGYRSVIWNHIIPEIGHYRLNKLTAAHIRRVHDRITRTPKNKDDLSKGYLSSSYALNAHRVLSSALKDAERENRVARNPATMLDAPRKARPELHALTVEQAIEVLRPLLVAFDDPDNYDPEPVRWATYLLTGARRGEVLGLETNRVGKRLDLSWQLQRVKDIHAAPVDYEYRPITNGMYWVRPKTNASWRTILLVDPLKTILQKHMDITGPNKYGLLFVNDRGLPIDPDTESGRWPQALREMDITEKHVRLHDLRHTTVDLLYEANVPEDVIMEIVGHSTRSVTRGYKARGNDRRHEGGMLQLSALLGY